MKMKTLLTKDARKAIQSADMIVARKPGEKTATALWSRPDIKTLIESGDDPENPDARIKMLQVEVRNDKELNEAYKIVQEQKRGINEGKLFLIWLLILDRPAIWGTDKDPDGPLIYSTLEEAQAMVDRHHTDAEGETDAEVAAWTPATLAMRMKEFGWTRFYRYVPDQSLLIGRTIEELLAQPT